MMCINFLKINKRKLLFFYFSRYQCLRDFLFDCFTLIVSVEKTDVEICMPFHCFYPKENYEDCRLSHVVDINTLEIAICSNFLPSDEYGDILQHDCLWSEDFEY